MFVIPSEFTEAFSGIGKALSGAASEIGRDSWAAGPPASRAGGFARSGGSCVERAAPAALRGPARCGVDVRLARRQTSGDLRGPRPGTLTEADINAALREIRLALLEADVNFKVVRASPPP